jgi:hypothetical protein
MADSRGTALLDDDEIPIAEATVPQSRDETDQSGLVLVLWLGLSDCSLLWKGSFRDRAVDDDDRFYRTSVSGHRESAAAVAAISGR